jgi:hypothetical protein
MSRSKGNTTSSLEVSWNTYILVRARRPRPIEALSIPPTTVPSPQDSSPRQPRVTIVYHFCALSLVLASFPAIFLRATVISTAIHQPSTDLPPVLSRLRVMPNHRWHRLLSLASARLLRPQRKSMVFCLRRDGKKDCRRALLPSLPSYKLSISQRHTPHGFRKLDCPVWCSGVRASPNRATGRSRRQWSAGF